MDPVAFLAGLSSAVLHASWNASVRSRPDPGHAVATVVTLTGVFALPVLFWSGIPASDALLFVLANGVLNIAALRLVMATYRRLPFSLGYPIMRGVSPLAVTAIGALLLRQAPGWLSVAGVTAVSAGIVSLARQGHRGGQGSVAGLVLAASAGALTALATLADATGIRLAHNPMAYGTAVIILNAVALPALLAFEGVRPAKFLRGNLRVGSLAALASMASYLLFLVALSRAAAGPATALRETSVLWGVLIAALVLKEPVSARRWAAVALACLGVVLIRLG